MFDTNIVRNFRAPILLPFYKKLPEIIEIIEKISVI